MSSNYLVVKLFVKKKKQVCVTLLCTRDLTLLFNLQLIFSGI